MRRILLAAGIACGALLLGTVVAEPAAAQTGYYPYVIARPQDRAKIRSTPIEQRPYRPLHFYGNTVRRNYYGRTFPAQIRRAVTPRRR